MISRCISSPCFCDASIREMTSAPYFLCGFTNVSVASARPDFLSTSCITTVVVPISTAQNVPLTPCGSSVASVRTDASCDSSVASARAGTSVTQGFVSVSDSRVIHPHLCSDTTVILKSFAKHNSILQSDTGFAVQASRYPSLSCSGVNTLLSDADGSGTPLKNLTRHLPQLPCPPQKPAASKAPVSRPSCRSVLSEPLDVPFSDTPPGRTAPVFSLRQSQKLSVSAR